MTDRAVVRVGELRRQVKLETEAVYRVLAVDVDADLIEVEVVRAPLLDRGRVMRLTRRAVLEMEIVPDAAAPPAD